MLKLILIVKNFKGDSTAVVEQTDATVGTSPLAENIREQEAEVMPMVKFVIFSNQFSYLEHHIHCSYPPLFPFSLSVRRTILYVILYNVQYSVHERGLKVSSTKSLAKISIFFHNSNRCL